LTPEQLPALSGGGCLSARDLARFDLLLQRGLSGDTAVNSDWLRASMTRARRRASPRRETGCAIQTT